MISDMYEKLFNIESNRISVELERLARSSNQEKFGIQIIGEIDDKGRMIVYAEPLKGDKND